MDPSELDREVRAELRPLAKTLADAIARRLIMVGELLDVAPEDALAHALAARQGAPRIGAVREAVGLAAYRNGDWRLAISELRAHQRISGRQTHLAVIADCERGLGRPERAIDMFRALDPKQVTRDEYTELLIVAAGARRDTGQLEAAAAMLQVPALRTGPAQTWVARLRYAYADTLVALGREDEAKEWFRQALDADPEGQTDAAERLLELEGVYLEDDDLEPDTEGEEPESAPVEVAPEPPVVAEPKAGPEPSADAEAGAKPEVEPEGSAESGPAEEAAPDEPAGESEPAGAGDDATREVGPANGGASGAARDSADRDPHEVAPQ